MAEPCSREEVYAIVYLDGFHLKVRMAKRVISVPVLVALRVAPDGHKRLLSLRLAVSEASTHWGSVLEGLQAQGLRAPKLVDCTFKCLVVISLSCEGEPLR